MYAHGRPRARAQLIRKPLPTPYVYVRLYTTVLSFLLLLPQGYAPIHVASLAQNKDIVILLMDGGAEVNSTDLVSTFLLCSSILYFLSIFITDGQNCSLHCLRTREFRIGVLAYNKRC